MAIKPEELRIGNWVNAPKLVVLGSCKSSECNDMLPFQVPYLTQTDHQIKLCEPIPLTPDILIACGFVDTDEYSNGYETTNGCKFYEHLEGYFVISERNGIYRKFWDVDEDVFYSWHGVEVKYLHQLQNLYYSLTGKEISYKP